MHPSRRFKAVAKAVSCLGVLGSIGLLANKAIFNNTTLEFLCQIDLLFVSNMAVALVARYGMKQAVWPSIKKRTIAATILIIVSFVLLFVDFEISDRIVGDEGGSLGYAAASLITATVWILAYTASWKPFLKQAENRYISAGISLTLGTVAMGLYFTSLFAAALNSGIGWKTEFVRFALACISLATSISAFTLQWDSRAERRRKMLAAKIDADSISIHCFDPINDIESAERFVAAGLGFDSLSRNSLESWLHSRNAVLEAVANATHLYGAYHHNRLVGFLLADMHGREKQYARSRYSCLRFTKSTIDRIVQKADSSSSFDEAKHRAVTALETNYDAEILLLATDPELTERGIGCKLIEAFEADFAGKNVYLALDETISTDFFEHSGFAIAKEYRTGIDAESDVVCRLLVKQVAAKSTPRDTALS